MSRRKWYLLAYDIRNPVRLRRTHAFVRKHGVALQRSVFLLQMDAREFDSLQHGIRNLVNDREDDVRIYPIRHPGVLWSAGLQQEAVRSLYAPVPGGEPGGMLAAVRRFFSRRRKKR